MAIWEVVPGPFLNTNGFALKWRTGAGAMAIWEVVPGPFLNTNGFAKYTVN